MIPLFTLIVKNILFLNCAKGLLFNIFKVFDGIGFKLVGGFVVTDDNAMLVHLEDADGPHMIDAALNGMVQRTGFFVAGNQNHNFFRVHNGSDTYGQDGCGHFADVVVKKAGIDLNGIFGQRLNPGAEWYISYIKYPSLSFCRSVRLLYPARLRPHSHKKEPPEGGSKATLGLSVLYEPKITQRSLRWSPRRHPRSQQPRLQQHEPR